MSHLQPSHIKMVRSKVLLEEIQLSARGAKGEFISVHVSSRACHSHLKWNHSAGHRDARLKSIFLITLALKASHQKRFKHSQKHRLHQKKADVTLTWLQSLLCFALAFGVVFCVVRREHRPNAQVFVGVVSCPPCFCSIERQALRIPHLFICIHREETSRRVLNLRAAPLCGVTGLICASNMLNKHALHRKQHVNSEMLMLNLTHSSK